MYITFTYIVMLLLFFHKNKCIQRHFTFMEDGGWGYTSIIITTVIRVYQYPILATPIPPILMYP